MVCFKTTLLPSLLLDYTRGAEWPEKLRVGSVFEPVCFLLLAMFKKHDIFGFFLVMCNPFLDPQIASFYWECSKKGVRKGSGHRMHARTDGRD